MMEMVKALRAIAEGAIVSPEQSPEKIAEQVLRVLRLVREENLEYLKIIGAQQKRAERAEEALEKIAALKYPPWGDANDILKIFHQCNAIARAAIAAAKGESDEENELVRATGKQARRR